VLVTARKFADLGVAGEAEAAELLGAPPQVESAARQLQAPELVASEQSALVAFDDLPRQPRDPAPAAAEPGRRSGEA
jgi:DNA recombination protein RmuC